MHTWGKLQSIRNRPSMTEYYNTVSLNMQICPMFSRQSQVHSVSPLSWTWTCLYWMEICLFSELFIFLHFTDSRRRKWERFLTAQTNTNRGLRQWKLSHHKLIMSLFKLTLSQFSFLPAWSLSVEELQALHTDSRTEPEVHTAPTNQQREKTNVKMI